MAFHNNSVLLLQAVGDVAAEAPLLRVPLRLGIWDKGAQIHKQCPGLTELGCLALALLEEVSQGSSSQRWPWLQVSMRIARIAAFHHSAGSTCMKESTFASTSHKQSEGDGHGCG